MYVAERYSFSSAIFYINVKIDLVVTLLIIFVCIAFPNVHNLEE